MTVKLSDFKHHTYVFLEGVGECLVCFDILTPGDELDPDHSDDYEIDFAVFNENDEPITYDISKRHYNRCENKATDEMLDITTAWHKEWEDSV